MTHIECISNGMGGPSMYMMVLAGQCKIPATLSITADTGWENDCLLSDGRRVTAQECYSDVIVPLGTEFGIETAFVRAQDGDGNPLPPLGEKMRSGIIPGVPTFGSDGGRLKQSCTGKYKIRAIRQELRRRGATTARCGLGLTLDEVHRMKQNTDVAWHKVYWPLIEEGLYRVSIEDRLNKMDIPFMVTSQCDGCPHQDYARWSRLKPETISDVIKIESGFNGTQFLTDRRKPLDQALEEMRAKQAAARAEQPERSLFDLCEGGYCEF
jgi:hypothetical protein